MPLVSLKLIVANSTYWNRLAILSGVAQMKWLLK